MTSEAGCLACGRLTRLFDSKTEITALSMHFFKVAEGGLTIRRRLDNLPHNGDPQIGYEYKPGKTAWEIAREKTRLG